MRRQLQRLQALFDDIASLPPQLWIAFGQHFQQALFFYQVGFGEVAIVLQQGTGVVDQIGQLDGFGLWGGCGDDRGSCVDSDFPRCRR